MLVDDRIRLAHWFQSTGVKGKDCVAIFDVGTKAVRVLVAPRHVPPKWDETTFFTDSRNPRIGLDVDDEYLDPRSQSLEQLIRFIGVRKSWLHKHGVSEFTLIATAWFRWLRNQDEVASLINKSTGLTIEEIPQEREAQLTTASLPFIEGRTLSPLPIHDGDLVLMLDQGGGSLEISWMPWSKNDPRPNLLSRRIEKFGTVKLQRDFFHANAGGNPVDPRNNQSGIRAQIQRVQKEAAVELRKNWSEKTALLRDQRRKNAFAVGTAITNVLPGGRQPHKIHGRIVTLGDVEDKLQKTADKYENINRKVLSLFKKLNGLEGSGVDKLPFKNEEVRRDLDLLCGLPIYAEIMKALKIPDITLFGYPLRFGYYVWKYGHNRPLSPVRPDRSGPYIVVSYDRDDRAVMYSELAVLAAMGVRVWWDEALIAGERWREVVYDAIEGSEALLFLLSPQSVTSTECSKEILHAIAYKRPIITVEPRQTQLIEPYRTLLEDIHRIQPSGMSEDDYFDAVRKAIPISVFQ